MDDLINEIIIDKVRFRMHVCITHCTADLPARAELQQLVQYNGYYNACPYCCHPGIQISIVRERNVNVFGTPQINNMICICLNFFFVVQNSRNVVFNAFF